MIKHSLKPWKSLSECLTEVEIHINKLGQKSTIQAEEILFELDEIKARLDNVKAQGRTAIGEEVQFEFLILSLKNVSKVFLKAIGGTRGLNILRSKRSPNQDASWWFLDVSFAKQRRALLKKRLIWLGVIMIVFVTIGLGIQGQIVLTPKPQNIMIDEPVIQNLLTKKNYIEVINQANLGLATDPKNATFLIVKGIAEQKLGKITEGNQTELQAEQLIGNQESFFLQRAIIFLRAEDMTSLSIDAQAVIALNPNSAEGYFLEGMAYGSFSNQEDDVKAYQAFVIARDLAYEQKNAPLGFIIAYNLAYIFPKLAPRQLIPTEGYLPTP